MAKHVDNRRISEKVTSTFAIVAWSHATLIFLLKLWGHMDLSWHFVTPFVIIWPLFWMIIALVVSYVSYLKDVADRDSE